MIKKIENIGKSLNRNECKQVLGGSIMQLQMALSDIDIEMATCDAQCTDDFGNKTTISCNGASCIAENGKGCQSDTETKSCKK